MECVHLFWNGEEVGSIGEMSAENFHIFGRFIPLNSKHCSDFIAAAEAEQEGMWVGFSAESVVGEVVYFDESTIEIRRKLK